MAKRPSEDAAVRTFLHRLNSPDAGAAWAEFIDHYSPLIMHAVRQFEFRHDCANECYLYVCEHLADNHFRRLLRFDTTGKATFSTWLGSVVYNLCVDWHRKEYGRAQMLPAITALPLLEQSVFHAYFEQDLDREACFQTLRDEFPDLGQARLSEAIARVHRVLTPRQRWQLGLRQQRRRAHDDQSAQIERFAIEAPGPPAVAESAQRREQLERAMQKLKPEERLLLQLRYVEGLTLREIAELLQLGDAFRARRMIDKSLDSIFKALPARSRGEI